MNQPATINDDGELFHGALLLRVERSLGLVQLGRPLVVRCALVSVLIGWLPMAILAAVQLLFSSQASAGSFFSDFAIHARFLLAVPALILAEADCVPRLEEIVRHFTKTGLVIAPDQARFQSAVCSTRRLRDSTMAVIITLGLAYLAVAALAYYYSKALPAWQAGASTGFNRFSPAGWWHVLVSLPLFLVLFFGWLWRLALWTRFLFLMSRLQLRLVPGHSDRVGGLRFVSTSLRGFRLISFALGAVVAGYVANRQIHQGADLLDFKNLAIGLGVFLLFLFAGPLVIFFPKLVEAKARGILEYGALARSVGRQLEKKWIGPSASVDASSLEAQDFSATIDLYSIAGNVYTMQKVPFSVRDLSPIFIFALIPFLPLVLLTIPPKVIFQALARLLF